MMLAVGLADAPWVGAAGIAAYVLWRLVGGRFKAMFLQRWSLRGEVAALALLSIGLVGFAARNVMQPEPWDFPVFYTVGDNAAHGQSLYEPEALAATFAELREESPVPPDWLEEFGYWYAPPSAMLLIPYGFVGYRTALVGHYLAQAAMLVGSILLLHRRFPLGFGRIALVRMALLFVAFRPVGSAVSLAQIVFGALVLEVWAMKHADDDAHVGLSLALAALVKHLMIIPVGLLLVAGRRRMFAFAIAGLASLCVLAGGVFGVGVYEEFAASGPGNRKPELAIYGVVQSLNATTHRLFNDVPDTAGVAATILYPPFLIAASAMTIITLVALRRATHNGKPAALSLGLALALSLMVYPNTLFNTLPLLVPVFVAMLHHVMFRPVEFGPGRWAAHRDLHWLAGGLAASYLLAAALPDHAFWANFFVWGAALHLVWHPDVQPAIAAPSPTVETLGGTA